MPKKPKSNDGARDDSSGRVTALVAFDEEGLAEAGPDTAIAIGTDSVPDTWFRKYAGVAAAKVLDFCNEHNIAREVKQAVGFAENCFQAPSSDVRLEEDIDPETDDRHIRISLTVRKKSPQEVLACYRDFRRQLMNLPDAKAMFIRLSYDIS